MKKLFITASVFTLLLVFASCKKNYTCTCTYIDNTGNEQTKIIHLHGTKTATQVDCNNYEKELTYYGRTVSCKL